MWLLMPQKRPRRYRSSSSAVPTQCSLDWPRALLGPRAMRPASRSCWTIQPRRGWSCSRKLYRECSALHSCGIRIILIMNCQKPSVLPQLSTYDCDPVEMQGSSELESALSAVANARPDALYVVSSRHTVLNIPRIVDFARTKRLPLAGGWGDWARAGGLISYGPNTDEMARTCR